MVLMTDVYTAITVECVWKSAQFILAVTVYPDRSKFIV